MIKIFVQRKEKNDDNVYWEKFVYDNKEHITIEVLLEEINSCNINCNDFRAIEWECSCAEGMCGACAMLINGKPGLACQTFCDEIMNIEREIYIQPLSKFLNIVDLIVDRTIMRENMMRMNIWKKKNDSLVKHITSTDKLGLCLMCGCCLEVCPSFINNNKFPGMSTMVALGDLVNEDNIELYKDTINNNIIDECIKDMNCSKVCPIRLPIAENFVNILRMINS